MLSQYGRRSRDADIAHDLIWNAHTGSAADWSVPTNTPLNERPIPPSVKVERTVLNPSLYENDSPCPNPVPIRPNPACDGSANVSALFHTAVPSTGVVKCDAAPLNQMAGLFAVPPLGNGSVTAYSFMIGLYALFVSTPKLAKATLPPVTATSCVSPLMASLTVASLATSPLPVIAGCGSNAEPEASMYIESR